MTRHSRVLLGRVGYSADLSYNQLMELEKEYITGLSELLEHYEVEHLDFWGQDDSLQFEGHVSSIAEEMMQNLCGDVCTLLQKDCTARMMVIDRNLLLVDLYHLETTRWRHERIEIQDAFYRRTFCGHGP